MVIILTAIRTYDGHLLMHQKLVCKWPNDYDFGFDIHSYKAWKAFLSVLRVNYKLLPRVDHKGNPIAYRVYNWGGMSGVSPKDASGMTLFPGVDAEGRKLKLIPYGFL